MVYKDFRQMLDKQKNIDAVIVATPDHSHAVIGLAAIQRGKHVYIQKPLAHSVYEARLLTEAARKHKVATQLGNQGHSGDGVRMLCTWIWDGAIGAVREVHAWTNRPVWPQGIEVGRPKETPPLPASLDWDLWIGPAAMRALSSDLSSGQLAGMVGFRHRVAGRLGMPYPRRAVLGPETEVSHERGRLHLHLLERPLEALPAQNENYPRSTIARFKFPAREDMPEVKLTWWDGGMMPPRPEELEAGRRMGDSDGGVLFIGDKGSLICGCYGRSPQLLPAEKMQAYKRPKAAIERIAGGEQGHEKDWVRACKGGKPASSNFDYSGPLSEMVLMGNLAVRYPQRKLPWDGEKMEVTNDSEANTYVRRHYREGWTL